MKSFFFSLSFEQYFVFSIMVLLLFTACSKEEEIKVEEAKDITVEEVQAEFNSRKVQNTNLRTNDPNNDMDIVWDLAIYKELDIGDVLFFPVKTNGEEKHYVSSGEGTKRFPVDYTSFGRAYKNELDEVVLDYVLPVPTKNSPKFTGYFLISDWGGDVKRIKFYENGDFIREAEVSQQSVTDGENNRSMSSCTIVDHYWCVTASSPTGNTFTTCTYEGSTITCEEAPGLAPPDPADPGLGGGGPSSPSGPNGTCAHPFIEGMYVDCDAVVCTEGFVVDENENCVPDCGDNMVLDDEGNCTTVADLWEDDICFDDGTFQQDECVLSIWNSLKHSNSAFGMLEGFLGENPQVKICFRIANLDDTSDNDINGNATPTYFRNKLNNITIRLNSQRLNRSMLSIARTLLHEMIHAELFRLLDEAGYRHEYEMFAGSTNSLALIWAFLQDNDYLQHEIMAQNYVDLMANALSELNPFLSSRGFISYCNQNSDWDWNSFYTHLAYSGLQETDTYNDFYNTPEKLQERNFYLQTGEMETNDCN